MKEKKHRCGTSVTNPQTLMLTLMRPDTVVFSPLLTQLSLWRNGGEWSLAAKPFSDEISFRPPRLLFIFIIKTCIDRMKVSKKALD